MGRGVNGLVLMTELRFREGRETGKLARQWRADVDVFAVEAIKKACSSCGESRVARSFPFISFPTK
jgi:hypothetical protein